MSKAVLYSIRPEYCKLILDGKKTVEVRKSIPKLDVPFRCYIYCTYGFGLIEYKDEVFPNLCISQKVSANKKWDNCCNGKVIAEFVCDWVECIDDFCGVFDIRNMQAVVWSCLSKKKLVEYADGKPLYFLHISDLIIYDEPKELSEFYRLGNPLICDGRNCENCNHLKYMQVNSDEWDYDCDCQHQLENRITLKKPPQSWCYVEELSGA